MVEGQLSIYEEFISLREAELADIKSKKAYRPFLHRFLGRNALAISLKELNASHELLAAKADYILQSAYISTFDSRRNHEKTMQNMEAHRQKADNSIFEQLHQIRMFNEDGSIHVPVETLEDIVAQALAAQDK